MTAEFSTQNTGRRGLLPAVVLFGSHATQPVLYFTSAIPNLFGTRDQFRLAGGVTKTVTEAGAECRKETWTEVVTHITVGHTQTKTSVESRFVTQTAVQYVILADCNLHLPECWDYRCEPPRSAEDPGLQGRKVTS
ncbi:hypothetical protein AAY473_004565 [Plecturocebus cupreus]